MNRTCQVKPVVGSVLKCESSLYQGMRLQFCHKHRLYSVIQIQFSHQTGSQRDAWVFSILADGCCTEGA